MPNGKMMMRNIRNGQTIVVDPRTLTVQPENAVNRGSPNKEDTE